jgi:hypothetical protein
MIDRLIISADEKTYFKEYLKIVVEAWRKFFPQVKIGLAFVTNEETINPAFLEIDNLEVTNFPIIPNLPISNQAKMARHYLACCYEQEVVTIEDIDTIPLQKIFFEDKFSQRKKDTILFVGKEVYDNTEDAGKCPISTMTSESNMLKKMINPEDLPYEQFISSFIGTCKFDKKEDISKDVFSDESLIRYLLDKNPVMVTKVERSVEIRTDWIDRSWWSIDSQKLKNHQYITCNFLRPFSTNYGNIQMVVDFIYGTKMTSKKEVIFKIKEDR